MNTLASLAGLLSVGLLAPAVLAYGLRTGSLFGTLVPAARAWVVAVLGLSSFLFCYGWLVKGNVVTAAAHDLAPYVVLVASADAGLPPAGLGGHGPVHRPPLRHRPRGQRRGHDRDDPGGHGELCRGPRGGGDRRLSDPGGARLLAAPLPDRAPAAKTSSPCWPSRASSSCSPSRSSSRSARPAFGSLSSSWSFSSSCRGSGRAPRPRGLPERRVRAWFLGTAAVAAVPGGGRRPLALPRPARRPGRAHLAASATAEVLREC